MGVRVGTVCVGPFLLFLLYLFLLLYFLFVPDFSSEGAGTLQPVQVKRRKLGVNIGKPRDGAKNAIGGAKPADDRLPVNFLRR
jgi:hypothetical protein